MKLKRLAGALLMIAAGLLACWAARAESALVPAIGVSAVAGRTLPAMYAGHLAASELGAQNLLPLSVAASASTALGTLTLAAQPATDADCQVTFNLSGAWASTFSNLNLPAGVAWQLSPQSASDFVLEATLPLSDTAPAGGREIWASSFADWNLPEGVFWELVSDPLGPPNYRHWMAALPPAFETSGDWRAML